MVFDRTENEPEEYDPEEEFRDPDSDSITIPRVSSEDAGSDLRSDLRSEHEADEADASIADADVDGDLLQTFWALVLVVNGAVLAYALALLFLVFEGAVTYSAYLLAAGLALTGFGVRRYRAFRRESTDDESAAAASDAEPTDGSPADAEVESADESERTD